MRRLAKPGYRFLAELVMLPSAIVTFAAILGVIGG